MECNGDVEPGGGDDCISIIRKSCGSLDESSAAEYRAGPAASEPACVEFFVFASASVAELTALDTWSRYNTKSTVSGMLRGALAAP